MSSGTGSGLGELLEQLPGVGAPDDGRAGDRPGATTAVPPGDQLPAAQEPRTPPVRPALTRPSEAAYRYALDVVHYEGGDLDSAPASARDTIRRWRAWQRYDEALAARAGTDQAGPPSEAEGAGAMSRGVPAALATRTTNLDPDWALIIDDLFPYLYQNWQPVTVPQAGHPRQGTPHVANTDGTRLSTHLALWAARHGHGYGWARRLLKKAEAAGLIRYVTHRTGGTQPRTWSQWVPLDPDAYERRLAEVLLTFQRARARTESSFG
jgi:hypothetical protein